MNFIKLPGDELLSTSLDKDSHLILVDPTQDIINDIKQKYPDGLNIKRLEIYWGKDIDSEIDFGINGNKYPLNCFININKKTNNIKLKNVIIQSDEGYENIDFLTNSIIKKGFLKAKFLGTEGYYYNPNVRYFIPSLLTLNTEDITNNYEELYYKCNTSGKIFLSDYVFKVASKIGTINIDDSRGYEIDFISPDWTNIKIKTSEESFYKPEIKLLTYTYTSSDLLKGILTIKDTDFGYRIDEYRIDDLKQFFNDFENCIFDANLINNTFILSIINKNKFRINFEDLIKDNPNNPNMSGLDIHLIMSNKDFNKLITYGDFFLDNNINLAKANSLKVENELTGEYFTKNHLESKYEGYRRNYLKINFLPDYISNALKEFYTSQTVLTTLDEVPYDVYNYEKDEDFIRRKGWILESTWRDEVEKQRDLEDLINEYKSKYTSEYEIKKYANDYSFSIIDKYNEIQTEYDAVSNRLTDSPDPTVQDVLEITKRFDLAKAKNKFYTIYKYKNIPDEILNKLPLIDIKQEEMEILTKNGYQLKIGDNVISLKRYYNIAVGNGSISNDCAGWSDNVPSPTLNAPTGSESCATFELPEFFHSVVKPYLKQTLVLQKNIGYDPSNPNLTIDNNFIKRFFDSEINIAIPTIRNLKIINGGKYKITASTINLETFKGNAEIDINCSSINVKCKGVQPIEIATSASQSRIKLTSNIDIENADIENVFFDTPNNINNLNFINSNVTADEIRNLNNSALSYNENFHEYNYSFINFTLTPNNIKQNFQDYGDATELAGKNYFELPAVNTQFTIKEQNPIFDDLVLVFKNGAKQLSDDLSYQNFNYFVDNTSYKNITTDSDYVAISLVPWIRGVNSTYNIENCLTKDEYGVLFGTYDLDTKYNDYIKSVKETQEEFRNFKQKYLKIYLKNEAGSPVFDIKGVSNFDSDYGKTIKKFIPLKVIGDQYNQQIVPLDDNLQLGENESIKIFRDGNVDFHSFLERASYKPGCFTYNNAGEIESPFLEIENNYGYTTKYIGAICEFDKNNIKSHIIKRAKNAVLHSSYFLSSECADSEIENVVIFGTPRDLRHLTDKKPLKDIGFYGDYWRGSFASNFNKENIFKFKDINGLYAIHLQSRPTRFSFACTCSIPTAVHAENCTFKLNDFKSAIRNEITFGYDIDKNNLKLNPGEYHYVHSPFINLDTLKLKNITNDEQACEILKDRSNRLPVTFIDNKTTKTFKSYPSGYNNPYDVNPIIDTGNLDYWTPGYREKHEKYTKLFEQKLNELRTLEGVEWSETRGVWLFRKYTNSFNYILNVGETEFGFQNINDRVVVTNPLIFLSNKCLGCDDKNNIKITNLHGLHYGYRYNETFVFNNKKYRIIKD